MLNELISVAYTTHDQNFYIDGSHIQLERFTREKANLGYNKKDFGYEYFQDIINSNRTIAFTYNDQAPVFYKLPFELQFNTRYPYRPNNLWDYIQEDNLYFIEHHQAHAAYAYIMSRFEQSDILSLDGGALGYTGMFIDKNGNIIDLTKSCTIGWYWDFISCSIQYKNKIIQTPGKLMGLVGYGKFNQEFYDFLLDDFLTDYEYIDPVRGWGRKWVDKLQTYSKNISPPDIAYTLQKYSNDKLIQLIEKYKTSDNICVSGGVAYNGYMNELLTKYYRNVFVPPAVGDEGISLGCYMHADYVINNNRHIPDLYAGLNYKVED
jgi:predicted NodU family carbamoyl transferase